MKTLQLHRTIGTKQQLKIKGALTPETIKALRKLTEAKIKSDEKRGN